MHFIISLFFFRILAMDLLCISALYKLKPTDAEEVGPTDCLFGGKLKNDCPDFAL